MDWYRIELSPNDAVSFESRWLVLYSKHGTPKGLFIFRGRNKKAQSQYFVPEPVRDAFRKFFANYDLQKCAQPRRGSLQAIGGSEDEVDEFYGRLVS